MENLGKKSFTSMLSPGYPRSSESEAETRSSVCIAPEGSGDGVYLGCMCAKNQRHDVTRPSNVSGHHLGIGGSGSGKSSTGVKGTIGRFKGSMVAMSLDGSLLDEMKARKSRKQPVKLLRLSTVKRTIHTYDVYKNLSNHCDENLLQEFVEIAQCIIPMPLDIREPFWVEISQSTLAALLLYYYKKGHTFIKSMELINSIPISEILFRIQSDGCHIVKMLLNPLLGLNMQEENKLLVSIMTTIGSKTHVFATDPTIKAALTPNKNSICWSKLERYSVFIDVEQSKLEQWGPVITMLLTQLIRKLECRPNMYTSAGKKTRPVLLLLDEFPRLGKIEVLTNALATLRVKKVTISLFVQSLSQLDLIYGKAVRCAMLDNISYTSIYSVQDVATQEYVSRYIGTQEVTQHSNSVSFSGGKWQNIVQKNTSVQPVIKGHLLRNLKKILIVTPTEHFWLNKAFSDEPTILEKNTTIFTKIKAKVIKGKDIVASTLKKCLPYISSQVAAVAATAVTKVATGFFKKMFGKVFG